MTMSFSRAWRGTMLVAAIAALAGSASAQTPVTLGVADRSNDAVSVAAAGQFVALVWGARASGGIDVYSAISRNGGTSFSAQVRVNAILFDASVGGEQPPHIVLVPRKGREPELVVVWTAKRAEGSRLLAARSTDGGVTFSASTVVPGSAAAGSRGWESIAVGRGGSVYALWLDHRKLDIGAPTRGAVAGGGPSAPIFDPVERAALSQLYFASLDGRVAAKGITGGVCFCCKTSMVTAPDGGVLAVWRHVFPGDLRDIAFTTSRDGGRTFSAPMRVSEDHWEFDGCPDNGPTVAVDGARRIHVAWPSPADVKNPMVMALFYAMSSNGQPFTPRIKIPTNGPAGHVQIVTEADGNVVLAWEEMSSTGRTIRLARANTLANGQIVLRSVGSTVAGKYPSMAVTSGGALVAWAQPVNGVSTIAVSRVPR